MRVLVTGATGFIGGRLVPMLVEQGHTVVAVGRDAARLERLRSAQTIMGDLRDAELFDRLPRRIDSVVHLAQANGTRPTEAELTAINTGGTAAVLEYARRAGAVSFVFTSSGSVYGGAGRLLSESDPPRPRDAYARSKLAAEKLVTEHATAFLGRTFRLFAPYGPGQRGRLVAELLDRVRSGRPVVLREGGRPRLTPIYVDHVVDVLVQAAAGAGAPLLNVAGDEILSIRDMAETIARVADVEPRFEHAAGEGQEDLLGDTTALRRQLHLPQPLITFEQGVATILAEAAPAR